MHSDRAQGFGDRCTPAEHQAGHAYGAAAARFACSPTCTASSLHLHRQQPPPAPPAAPPALPAAPPALPAAPPALPAAPSALPAAPPAPPAALPAPPAAPPAPPAAPPAPPAAPPAPPAAPPAPARFACSPTCTSRQPCWPQRPRSTSRSSRPGGWWRATARACRSATRSRSTGACGTPPLPGHKLAVSSHARPIASAVSASATCTTTI
eukprot:365043-Chlamydomonas_euryale.AAC.19